MSDIFTTIPDEAVDDETLSAILSSLINTNDIRTVFQPIVLLTTGEIFGYEALSRGPANTFLEPPMSLFAAAAKINMTWEIEFECLKLAINRFAEQNHKKTHLFLNISPFIIQDNRFYEAINVYELALKGLTPENIIFEITEQVEITNPKAFRELLDFYRHLDFKFAVDDVGDGYAGLSLISKINPHYLKIDKGLIKDIAHDPLRQHLVRSIASFTTGMGMGLVAEGLENEDDLNCVCSLGVSYGQGYLLGYPVPKLAHLDEKIQEWLSVKAKGNISLTSGIRVGSVCRTIPPISPDMTVKELSTEWHSKDYDTCKPVIDKGVPLGLIMRDSLFSRLATPYGYSLYSRKNVKSIMEPDPLIIEQDVSVEIAAVKALARPESRTYENIIVTDRGRYYGLVTLKDLLSHLTAQSLARAHTANPLTGLPGNPVIQSELTRVLATRLPFNLCYCDLDNFKAFNDAYGFTRGDAVIQSLSNILQETFGPQSDTPAFVGHIGGDDFIILSDNPMPVEVLEKVLKTFDTNIPIYYDQDARERGSIEAINRQGEKISLPLCSLSIAVVAFENGPFATPQSLTQRAAEVKHRCKAVPGSCICFDQRHYNFNPFGSASHEIDNNN